MKAFKYRKGSEWVLVASALLAVFTVFVLLDTFALARVEQQVDSADTSALFESLAESENKEVAAESEQADTPIESDNAGAPEEAENSVVESFSQSGPVVTDTSYADDNISVELSTTRAYDTTVYIADIQVSSAEYLKTAFAQNAYGRNIKDETSSIAEQVGAVLAINGDYYGFRDDGYVLRNGVLYRETPTQSTDALVIYADGSMAAANQDEVSASELEAAGAWQVLSFGPVLIEDGELAVVEGQEVSGKSKASNPRTAIGMISPLHYIVVVSDGRTEGEAGLSLAQLAQVMKDAGAEFAYNLDGGGSSTMWFMGEIINTPTGGRGSNERSVSDIVYFG